MAASSQWPRQRCGSSGQAEQHVPGPELCLAEVAAAHTACSHLTEHVYDS